MRCPILLLLLPFALPGCAHSGASIRTGREASPADRLAQEERSKAPRLEPGRTLLQGLVGASLLSKVQHEPEEGGVDLAADVDLDLLPMLGGAGMWPLGGGRVHYGIEGGLTFGFWTDGGTLETSGGSTAAVDVDLLLLDLFAGPFVGGFLGDRVRVYAGAGPLGQFAQLEQSGEGVGDRGSGFGLGYYGRAGVEYVLSNRTMLGIGARWISSEVDLGGDLGDLELEGTQVFISVTTGL